MNESEIMETMTFEELIQINCFSEEKKNEKKAAELLEYRYGCEIRCGEMDKKCPLCSPCSRLYDHCCETLRQCCDFPECNDWFKSAV